MFYVYILKNSESKYYTGMTSKPPEARLKEHNSNANKWTKNKGPWGLIYAKAFETKKEAWLRERQIKKYKGGSAFKELIRRGA
ncbi:MAG: GIY-YIG nuclease family protein [Candidatus Omnitrophica bacterium]|nr:GIY-YIG nuclease family protein [Candidatus Omnitrophota bacterium]